MATGTRRLDIEALHRYLRDARFQGARAVHLLYYVPELVDLLFPPEQHPEWSPDQRAVETQILIRRGIDVIGGAAGHALAIVLCLAPGTSETTLTQRRSKAASHLGIQLKTWMKRAHEAQLLHGLALEVYQLHRDLPAPVSA